jgi:hypothetical protein
LHFFEPADLRGSNEKFKRAGCAADSLSEWTPGARRARRHRKPPGMRRGREANMMRTWMGVALTVAGLGLAVPAWAQAPLPEPLPVGTAMNPSPGAVPAAQCNPAGPASEVVLPASLPGAFTDCPPVGETGVYFHIGTQGMMRQQLRHGPVAIIDLLNPTNLKNGLPPVAARFTQVVQEFSDLEPGMEFGPRVTLGYMWDNQALEFTGFFVPNNTSETVVARQGRLDLFFIHPPLGFEGDNGMWLHADRNVLTMFNSLGNMEANYRWWNPAITEAELIVGVRFIDQQEHLSIFTGDDDLSVHDINGNPDPKRQADYSSRVHNMIVGGQIGLEGHIGILRWLALSYDAKVAPGINFAQTDVTLRRGDGFWGRAAHHSEYLFSQVYDGGIYLDFLITERLRIRAGYNGFWLVNVAEATQQVRFDLRPKAQAQQQIRVDDIFYHGPQIEVQFLF